MKYRILGRTDIRVGSIGLGTMTFGEQTSEADAHSQLDYALERGVNFIDTAELYAVPSRPETYGRTEEFIGRWLSNSGARDRVVLASKIAGPGEGWINWIRGGKTRFDQHNLQAAVEGSLRRLQTDHLDLYQLHWPDRNTNFFGKLGYQAEDEPPTHVEETLRALDDLVRTGKVRHIGLSNETPWGVMSFLHHADQHGLARVVSVQNPYSLLNRSFEVGLAEVAHREHTGLLAYSPLGFGALSGKYLDDTMPDGARLTLYPHYDRYSNEQAVAATRKYVALARRHGLDPAQMALAFIHTRPFLTATIIGATSLEQLQRNIDSIDLILPEEVLDEIEAIHQQHPNPAP